MPRSDAFWCPSIGRVGDTRAFSSARLIRRTENGPSTSEPFPYAVAVEAHGRHVDYGGDVGVVDAVLVTTFTPHVGKTADGYTERHHWAVKAGRAIGLVRYTEIRHGKVAREFTFNRNAPSRSVPLSSLIVHPIPDPPPTLDPEPDPMPTIPEPIITDPEAADAGGRIEHHYAKYAERVGYGARTVHTNPLSYVWGIRYYQERQRGIGHEPAIQAVERAMSAAAGVGEPDPPTEGETEEPTEPSPVPPSTRRGQLTTDGWAFRDKNGDVLPYYIHQGDAISLFARDEAKAEAHLDEAVMLGADGIRPWSVLVGLPFWQGRTTSASVALLIRFVEACKARGLRLVLSQGDAWQLGTSAARDYIARLAEVIRTCGPEWFDFVDAGNETWHNGCDDPNTLASAMRPLVGLGPLLLLTDAPEGGPYPPGDEGKRLYREHMARWCQSPASVLALHSQFSDPDGCIRRVWNGGYETGRWLRIEDELRGHGRNVTVCNVFTASQQLAMAAAGWISGAAMVFLCSAGVISDGMKNGHFDQGESFLDAPGFRRLAELRAWLPRGVMRWKRVHGGDRPGSPRVFATNAEDETRADHAINEATGEYVCVISGESRHRVSRVRAASEEDFPGLDDGYRIVKGVAR